MAAELIRRGLRWATAATVALLLVGFAREEPEAKPEDKPTQAAHGRGATAPSPFPAAGWKDVLWRIYENLNEHRIVAIAAGVTFYTLLAIFPCIAALVALYGLFSDPSTISMHLDVLSGVAPGGATEIIGEQLSRLSSQPRGTLGLAFLVSLAISLWSANSGMKALFDALNIVYGEKEKRSFLKLNALSLTFTACAIVFLLISLAAIAVLPHVIGYVALTPEIEQLIALGKWPVLLLVFAFALALIYRYGPSREERQWRWITPGSAVAAVTWLIVSALFSWYAESFGNFNKTYGSLGAAIGFMTWIWISTIVILLGAELDAEVEHQTARDTTTGRPKPLGTRGARVADTVGHPSD
jgi:membrane protein